MKQSIMPYKEIQLWLNSITDLTTQHLISVQYATGSRIGELVEYTHPWILAINFPSIQTQKNLIWTLLCIKKRKMVNEHPRTTIYPRRIRPSLSIQRKQSKKTHQKRTKQTITNHKHPRPKKQCHKQNIQLTQPKSNKNNTPN